MKILILDDEAYRHFIFDIKFQGHEVTHVYTADEAIAALDADDTYDLVQLDHDLADKDYRELKAGVVGEKTGVDAAVHIARYMDRSKVPVRVVVHSLNGPGACLMRDLLRDAGINVAYIPFDTSGVV
jgi:CheY-like chemotaxis protein